MTRKTPSIPLAKPMCHMTTQTEDILSDSGTEVEDIATMEMDDLDRFCTLRALVRMVTWVDKTGLVSVFLHLPAQHVYGTACP